MTKTEKLIKIIRNYPILFDLSHEDYKSTAKKDKIWSDIGKELDETGEEVKKKWKNLRDTYAKYIKTNKKRAAQTGKMTRKWLWAEEMKAFHPYLTFTKTSNVSDDSVNSVSEEVSPKCGMESGDNFKTKNILSEYSENSFIEINTEHEETHSQVINDIKSAHCTQLPASYATGTTTIPTKQKIDRNRALESLSSPGKMIKHFENKTETEYDATECLFLAYAKTVKTFSVRRRAITKMKIAQVIMEQEILHGEELASTVPLSRSEKSNNHNNSLHSKNASSSDEEVYFLQSV